MWKFKIIVLMSLFAASVSAQQVDLDKYQPLVSDAKPYSVGEPIVVLVVETTTAEASAGTGVERNTSNDTQAVSAALGIDSNSDGAGKTSRKGKVATQLSASIIEVLAHGMLKIKGSQDITINGEKQTVIVSGLIRVKDISKNNSVFSYQISDAVLEISGDGDLNRAQRQNIFYRFFTWIGLL
jgi:flagellar L-ring protein FlgH